jgi:hypothetical protein
MQPSNFPKQVLDQYCIVIDCCRDERLKFFTAEKHEMRACFDNVNIPGVP